MRMRAWLMLALIIASIISLAIVGIDAQATW